MADAKTKTAAAVIEPDKPQHPLFTLRKQLDARTEEFKSALPASLPPERFVRVVTTAVQLNPELIVCNRQTFFNSCMRAANDGCLPDGREGVIVVFNDNNPKSPYKGQKVAVWMRMVAGDLKRFRNSGEFKSITAGVVRAGEPFEHWIDEHGEHLRHVPGDDDGNNDKISKAYAVALLREGGVMIKVMSRADVEKRRHSGQAPNSLMWTKFYEEGCMKTVLRNLAKRLPASSDDLDRLQRDDDDELAPPIAPPEPRLQLSVETALDRFAGDPPEPVSDEPAAKVDPDQAAADFFGTSDEPNEVMRTRIATAHERGKQARQDGFERKAMPPEYREAPRKAEAEAWREGYDANEVAGAGTSKA